MIMQQKEHCIHDQHKSFLKIETLLKLNINGSVVGMGCQGFFYCVELNSKVKCLPMLRITPQVFCGVNTCSALVVFGDLRREYFMLTAGRRVCVHV